MGGRFRRSARQGGDAGDARGAETLAPAEVSGANGGVAKTLAVDARALWGSGIGRYAREIIGGLAALGGFDRIRLIGAPKELEPFVASLSPAAKLEIIALKGGRYSPVAQAGWMAIMARGGLAEGTPFPPLGGALLSLPP